MAKTDLLQGTLDLLILRVLNRGPMHGWGIALRIHQMSQDVLTVEEGSLYPALQRLLVQGWVTSRWETSSTSRRARFYDLTEAGRRQLQQETSAYDRMVAAVAAIMQAG